MRSADSTGLLLIRAWLEPAAQGEGEPAIRARMTRVLDVASEEGETLVLAGGETILAAVERWLADLAAQSR
jgi:hypothetical protein